MTGPYKGSCLCGEIRFEVDEFLSTIGHCHCSMCRKFHGAAFATLADVPAEHFRWTAGEHLLKGYTAQNGTIRRFCINCGSSLTFFTPNGPSDIVEIAMGCFDDDVPVKANAHIFVASGANWFEHEDELPHFEAGRRSRQIK
ncbi:MAG: GFA family protein [Chloroflexota bacterium]